VTGSSFTGSPGRLAAAIVRTVAYADVFDYPLTAAEIWRYLDTLPASPDDVVAALGTDSFVTASLGVRDGFYHLLARPAIVETRRTRAAAAAGQWPRAIGYGHALARLPFIRMVAVTGALAMDNVQQHTDIDFLVVTESGRLWLARAGAIALVRLAQRRGDVLCPNYVISDRALTFDERNLFTAHELAQMVPLSGQDVYERLRESNRWTSDFLPNASGPPRAWWAAGRRSRLQRAGELLGRSRLGGRFERWEMDRKLRKFHAASVHVPEARFSADVCKGHLQGHGARIVAAYADRLAALGLD
jgi:hypothetical protein